MAEQTFTLPILRFATLYPYADFRAGVASWHGVNMVRTPFDAEFLRGEFDTAYLSLVELVTGDGLGEARLDISIRTNPNHLPSGQGLGGHQRLTDQWELNGWVKVEHKGTSVTIHTMGRDRSSRYDLALGEVEGSVNLAAEAVIRSIRSDLSTAATITFNDGAVDTATIANKPAASIRENQTYDFNIADASSATGTLSWAVAGGATNGSIDTDGVYTPPNISANLQATIELHDSGESPTLVDSAILTVEPVFTGEIGGKPPNNLLAENETATFTAVNISAGDTPTWSLVRGGGSLVAAGDNLSAVYTPPNISVPIRQVLIRMTVGTLVVDYALTVVQVLLPSIDNKIATLRENATHDFNVDNEAAATGTLTWEIEGGEGSADPFSDFTTGGITFVTQLARRDHAAGTVPVTSYFLDDAALGLTSVNYAVYGLQGYATPTGARLAKNMAGDGWSGEYDGAGGARKGTVVSDTLLNNYSGPVAGGTNISLDDTKTISGHHVVAVVVSGNLIPSDPETANDPADLPAFASGMVPVEDLTDGHPDPHGLDQAIGAVSMSEVDNTTVNVTMGSAQRLAAIHGYTFATFDKIFDENRATGLQSLVEGAAFSDYAFLLVKYWDRFGASSSDWSYGVVEVDTFASDSVTQYWLGETESRTPPHIIWSSDTQFNAPGNEPIYKIYGIGITGDATITFNDGGGDKGTINPNTGLYTPPDVTDPVDVTVRLLEGTVVRDTDDFTVTAVFTGTISNKITTLRADETHTFTATGVSGGDTPVWSVKAGSGSIDSATGLYTPLSTITENVDVVVALTVGGVEQDTNRFRVDAVASDTQFAFRVSASAPSLPAPANQRSSNRPPTGWSFVAPDATTTEGVWRISRSITLVGEVFSEATTDWAWNPNTQPADPWTQPAPDVREQFAYIRGERLPNLPRSTGESLPAGWTDTAPGSTTTEAVYRIVRNVSARLGVFVSATPWQWSPARASQPWLPAATVISRQDAFRRAASLDEATDLPTSRLEALPTGWQATAPARTETMGIWRITRVVTRRLGVFDSATAWAWSPAYEAQPYILALEDISDSVRTYTATVRHRETGVLAQVQYTLRADAAIGINGVPGRNAVSQIYAATLIAGTPDANDEARLSASGTAVTALTADNCETVDKLEVGISNDDTDPTKERRRYYAQLRAGAVVSVYENRTTNWCDYLVSSVPASVASNARTVSYGLTYLERGGDAIDIRSAVSIGYSQALRGEDAVTYREIPVYQKLGISAALPTAPASPTWAQATEALGGITGWSTTFPDYDATTERVACVFVLVASTDTAEVLGSVRICENPGDINAVFRRAATKPDRLADGAARVPANTHDTSQTVPGGTGIVWVAIGSRATMSGTWKWSDWERLDAVSYREIAVYQVIGINAALPSAPTAATASGGNFTLSGLGDWTRAFPTYNASTQRVVCTQTTAGSDNSISSWSGVFVCESPADINTVYRRLDTQPAALADGTARVPDGTSDDEAGTTGANPLWSNTGHRNALSQPWKWDGWIRVEGQDGAAGTSYVEKSVYQVVGINAALPATPTTITASGGNFALGTLGSWRSAFPTYNAQTERVACTQATIGSDNSVGTWSAVFVCESPADINTVYRRSINKPNALADGTARIPSGTNDDESGTTGTNALWSNTGHRNALAQPWKWGGWVKIEGSDAVQRDINLYVADKTTTTVDVGAARPSEAPTSYEFKIFERTGNTELQTKTGAGDATGFVAQFTALTAGTRYRVEGKAIYGTGGSAEDGPVAIQYVNTAVAGATTSGGAGLLVVPADSTSVRASVPALSGASPSYQWEYDLGPDDDRSWRGRTTTTTNEQTISARRGNTPIHVRYRHNGGAGSVYGGWIFVGTAWTVADSQAPGPPRNVVLEITTDGQPRLTFEAPASKPRPIHRYVAFLYINSTTSVRQFGTAGFDNPDLTLARSTERVSAAGSYHAEVRAFSLAADDDSSTGGDDLAGTWAISNTVGFGGAATENTGQLNIRVVDKSSTILIVATPPPQGDRTVDTYEWELINEDSETVDTESLAPETSGSRVEFDELVPGETYTVRAFAEFQDGSTGPTDLLPVQLPAVGTGFRVVALSSSEVMASVPPEETTGDVEYEWQYDRGQGNVRTWNNEPSTTTPHTTIGGFRGNTTVTVRYKARINNAQAAWRTVGTTWTVQDAGAPNPCTDVQLTIDSAGIPYVQWTAPTGNPNAIHRYAARLYLGEVLVSTLGSGGYDNPNLTTQRFGNELTQYGVYHAEVRAISVDPDGDDPDTGLDDLAGDWASSAEVEWGGKSVTSLARRAAEQVLVEQGVMGVASLTISDITVYVVPGEGVMKTVYLLIPYKLTGFTGEIASVRIQFSTNLWTTTINQDAAIATTRRTYNQSTLDFDSSVELRITSTDGSRITSNLVDFSVDSATDPVLAAVASVDNAAYGGDLAYYVHLTIRAFGGTGTYTGAGPKIRRITTTGTVTLTGTITDSANNSATWSLDVVVPLAPSGTMPGELGSALSVTAMATGFRWINSNADYSVSVATTISGGVQPWRGDRGTVTRVIDDAVPGQSYILTGTVTDSSTPQQTAEWSISVTPFGKPRPFSFIVEARRFRNREFTGKRAIFLSGSNLYVSRDSADGARFGTYNNDGSFKGYLNRQVPVPAPGMVPSPYSFGPSTVRNSWRLHGCHLYNLVRDDGFAGFSSGAWSIVGSFSTGGTTPTAPQLSSTTAGYTNHIYFAPPPDVNDRSVYDSTTGAYEGIDMTYTGYWEGYVQASITTRRPETVTRRTGTFRIYWDLDAYNAYRNS